MAGLLALGAAACGDDVEIVQPTPPVAPPPPPVTATMAPASASVLIGNSVVFAVNASGGVSGDAASWTCASSNTGIATVSVVSAGCQATGAAAGDVSITATVTKSGETVNVGAQLTVTEEATGEPAFLILKGVTGEPAEGEETKTDAGGLKGRVEVSLGVERGDQTLERLSVLLDGEVVAYQSFGSSMGMAAPEDDAAAEQAVYDFTLSFDSDDYDADTGATTYANGEHMLSAELQIAGGMMSDGMMGHETISSNVMTVEFDNDDGYIVTADLGHNSVLADDGKRWYGGPDNGHIVISALAVSYSGAEAEAVTVTLTDCKGTAEEGDDDHDHGGAGVSFEFDCDDTERADRDIGVSAGGEPGQNILNEDDLPTANIDMKAPANAPMIIANRNGREMGWINADVGISGKFDARRARDNWLVEGEGGAGEAGVGGYNMAIRIGEDLEEAVGDDATSSLPAESEDNDAYCAVAVATDDLGNMTELPDADDDTCRAAPEGADTMLTFDPDADGGTDTISVYGYDSDGDDDQDPNTVSGNVSQANSTLEFGVDTTDPIVELVDDEADMRFAVVPFPDGSGLAFDVNDDASDVGNSDLTEDGGLRVKVNRRTASKSDCAAVQANGTVRGSADKDCEYMVITDDDVNFEADSLSVAYYTVSAIAKDKAGNTSSPVSHTLVYDATAASGTPPAVPGSIEAGKTFTGSVYLNDNLSIRDYYGTMDYGTGTPIRLGVGAPVVVDAFNSSSLTRLNHQVSQTVGIVTSATSVADPYKGLQTSLGGTIEPLSTVTIFVRDQAQAAYGTGTPSAALTLTKAAAADDGFATDAGFASAFQGLGNDDDYEVCGYAKCTDDDLSSTLNIRVRAAASAAGSFGDPYERVDFWVTDINGASWLIGSDSSGSSGRVGGTGGDARNRTWTYSHRVSGTMLRMLTRPGTGGTETAQIRAIGVNDEGVGLVTTLELAAEDFGTEDTSD